MIEQAPVIRLGSAASQLDRRAAQVGWVLAFAVLPAALLALFTIHVPRATYAWDFHAFWYAAHEFVHGGDPYARGFTETGRPLAAYVYPPMLAELIAPLGLLPFMAAAIAFTVASAAAVVAALAVLGVRDWRCYGAAFLWIPTLHGLRLGAVTAFLALLVAVAWRYRDATTRRAFVTASTVSLKLFLWPLLAWWRAGRNLRDATVAGAAAAGLIAVSWAVVGFEGLTSYPALLRRAQHQWINDGYGIATAVHALGVPAGAVDIAMTLAGAIGIAAVVQLAHRERITSSEMLAVLLGLALLVSPALWLHYATLLVIPLAILTPRLGLPWFVPLALWLTPSEESHGELWRIAVAVSAITLTILLAIRGSRRTPNIPLPG